MPTAAARTLRTAPPELVSEIMSETATFVQYHRGWTICLYRVDDTYEVFGPHPMESAAGFRTIRDAMDHIDYYERY